MYACSIVALLFNELTHSFLITLSKTSFHTLITFVRINRSKDEAIRRTTKTKRERIDPSNQGFNRNTCIS